MATPPSDDTKTLFKLLADGRWHTYSEVREKLAATVPPGRALRKYQERVDYARQYKNDPDYDTSASENDRIYFGQKACAQIVLTSWKERGLEYSGAGPNRQVRIRPGFKAWGLEPEGVPAPTKEGSDRLEPDPQPPEEASVSEPVPPSEGRCDCIAANLELPVAEPTAIDLGYLSLPPLLAVGTADLPPPPVTASEQEAAVPEPESEPEEALPDPEIPVVLAQIPAVDRTDMALFSESEIRHLIEGVVGTLLDEFQVGLQRYLQGQFSQLEAIVHSLDRAPTTWRIRRVKE